MSIATKQRFVMNQITQQYFLPQLGEVVGRVIECRGGNLVMVEDENGERYLASIPSKFRKLIWMKRGSFVFLMPIEEGMKVKAEITQILDNDNILYVREQNLWPLRFDGFAQKMTREARRGIVNGGNKKHDIIDDDMLPPSDSSDDDDENSASKKQEYVGSQDSTDGDNDEDEEDSDGSDDEQLIETYNPNHLRRL